MTDNPLRILMLVAWEVEKTDHDDLSKLSADIFVKKEGYWFLKYWPRIQDDIDVEGLSRSKLLRLLEKSLLKIYLIHAVMWFLFKVPKYDLIICFHSQVGLPMAFLFRLFGSHKPLILFDVEGIGRKHGLAAKVLIDFVLSKISMLFYFASVQHEDYVQHYPKVVSRCRFIPLGIDVGRFQQYRVKKNGNYIAAIGYQDRRFRDWDTLVEAYRMCNIDVPLLIIGKDRFTPHDLRNPENLPSGIKFVGKVPFKTLNRLVAGAKFVILPLPKRRHQYGAVTFLGAMALGKTVVVSDVSAIRDLTLDGDERFQYRAGTPSSLASIIDRVLHGSDDYALSDERYVNHVSNGFSEKIMGRIFYDVLSAEKIVR